MGRSVTIVSQALPVPFEPICHMMVSLRCSSDSMSVKSVLMFHVLLHHCNKMITVTLEHICQTAETWIYPYEGIQIINSLW